MSRSITVGGGCFWCIEGVFQQLPAVHQAISGYAGGESPDPSYREVCSGRTGHAEVVQVNFDPEQVEERALMELFFAIHDPTLHNRQGPDVGSQYRSIILYADKEQRQTAEAVIKEIGAAGEYSAPIVTELVPLTTFYPAEEMHQRYYEAAPEAPYCRSMIAPKIAKARERFPRLFDGWAN